MHYLKCSSCGHLNEVNNGNQIFCSSCNRRLDNNFFSWQKDNPEKNLDDFKRLMCVSDEDLQQANAKTKQSPKGMKYWLSFIVGTLLLYVVGHFGGEYIVNFFKSEKTSKEVMEKTWFSETYGDFGLVVETPVKMTKSELSLPAEYKQYIDKMDTYQYISAKGFKVMINLVKYADAVGEVNLEGAALGSINEMKMGQGVTDFDYQEEETTLNNIPGIIQRGMMMNKGIKIHFINIAYGMGLNLWQVMVAYQEGDEIGRIASERVVKSIKINDHATLQ